LEYSTLAGVVVIAGSAEVVRNATLDRASASLSAWGWSAGQMGAEAAVGHAKECRSSVKRGLACASPIVPGSVRDPGSRCKTNSPGPACPSKISHRCHIHPDVQPPGNFSKVGSTALTRNRRITSGKSNSGAVEPMRGSMTRHTEREDGVDPIRRSGVMKPIKGSKVSHEVGGRPVDGQTLQAVEPIEI